MHRTLKNMMKSVLETYAGDWDETVSWLMFAYREVPVESLLFSPFELLLGRDARGVLQLIKQNWLNDDVVQNLKSANVIDFVLNLRKKIKISLVTANEIESNAKKKSKIYYDRKSQQDSFDVGDQVLLLLPLRGKPLQARYSGPYTVEARIGEVDYVVLTHDRRKTKRIVHRNLMKRFHVRNTALVALVATPVAVNPDDQ